MFQKHVRKLSCATGTLVDDAASRFVKAENDRSMDYSQCDIHGQRR